MWLRGLGQTRASGVDCSAPAPSADAGEGRGRGLGLSSALLTCLRHHPASGLQFSPTLSHSRLDSALLGVVQPPSLSCRPVVSSVELNFCFIWFLCAAAGREPGAATRGESHLEGSRERPAEGGWRVEAAWACPIHGARPSVGTTGGQVPVGKGASEPMGDGLAHRNPRSSP